VQEDSLCYDQIRSTEMLAHFDSTGALTRFDALGDASAIFYLQEDSVYATVNKSEAKMLYAIFLDGNIDKVYYFEAAKNDGYPLAQMTERDKTLKGFSWQPELRPSGPQDITERTVRPTQRRIYASRPRATFHYTDIYFPGYMPGVLKQIEQGRTARPAERPRADTLHSEPPDTSAAVAADTSSVSARSVRDSSAVAARDSLSVASDTLSVADSLTADQPLLKDEKALKAEQRAAERAARIAAREAKWARLDSLDAVKAQAKADRKRAKVRLRKAKVLLKQHEQERKDAERLGRYISRYTARRDRRSR